MKEGQAIDRLRQVLRRQQKALATEDAYVLWLRRYPGWVGCLKENRQFI